MLMLGKLYSNSSIDIGAAVIYSLALLALYGLDLMARPPKWAVSTSRRIPWWPKVAEH